MTVVATSVDTTVEKAVVAKAEATVAATMEVAVEVASSRGERPRPGASGASVRRSASAAAAGVSGSVGV